MHFVAAIVVASLIVDIFDNKTKNLCHAYYL